MTVQTLVYDMLPQLCGTSIIIFGTDQRSVDLTRFIREQGLDITIKFYLDFHTTSTHEGLSAYAASSYLQWHNLAGEHVVVANDMPLAAYEILASTRASTISLCSRQLHGLFAPGQTPPVEQAEVSHTPFMLERGTPRVRTLVTTAYQDEEHDIYEVADFDRQEYVIYKVPLARFPLSLGDFSSRVPQEALPGGLNHLQYLYWKRGTHVVQLSYSRRYIVAPRYNFFHLDILDTHTGTVTRWQDKTADGKLWVYVATGDFDDDEESFYFVRWLWEDSMRATVDGSGMVTCQTGKLHLDTQEAEIFNESPFMDYVHQVTISGDKQYLVYAPMRTPYVQSSDLLQDETLMQRLRDTIPADDMATVDLKTAVVRHTRIPFPIPAHFELDPLDPHVFYVSTHSLVPHAKGVLVFQPGTLHKVRIGEQETYVEATYTHPKLIRRTQHCLFQHEDRLLLGITNQNKLELVDAASMSLWRRFTFCDDPLYDDADFDNVDFLKKPYSLPPRPSHCDSIAASADGRHLILRTPECFVVFDVAENALVGKVLPGTRAPVMGHSRYYMQNAPQALLQRRYAELS